MLLSIYSVGSFRADSCWIPSESVGLFSVLFLSLHSARLLLLTCLSPFLFLLLQWFVFIPPSFSPPIHCCTLFGPYPPSSCVDGGSSWIYGFLHRRLISEGDQNDFTARCVGWRGVAAVKGMGSKLKQHTTLFYFIYLSVYVCVGWGGGAVGCSYEIQKNRVFHSSFWFYSVFVCFFLVVFVHV